MSNIIKVTNTYSWLLTENANLRDKLYRSLRVHGKNYWHSTLYKKKIWDGYIEFFKKNSGMFLTGLLPEVAASLKVWNEPYTFQDERPPTQWLHKNIDEKFLHQWAPDGEPKFHLYDYQVDYVNQAIRFGRGLIVAPTGAGKTNVLISILKSLPPKTPTLFLTKNSGLVNQNYEEMKKWSIEGLGRFYGGFKEPNFVMCCTVHKDTFGSIDRLLPKFKALIVDEVHECMSKIPVNAYKKMTNATIRLGISATPFKYAGKDKEQKFNVKGHFGAVFRTTTTESGYLTTKELQDRKILSKSRCTVYKINEPNNIQHEPYGDAVTLGIANNFFFLKTIQKLAASLKGRTLILVERIDQGEYLKQLIPHAHWISGKDKLSVKADVFKELREQDNCVAIAIRHIITAGINVFLHNLINASGGAAEHAIIQQMGRGLRCAEDKEYLDFYDFIFRTNQYLEDHSMNRIKTLAEQGHEITIKEEFDF